MHDFENRRHSQQPEYLAAETATRLRMRVAWQGLIASMLLAASAGTIATADGDRNARQAELDVACEAAREAKLAPLRAQFVEECVEKDQRPDRASCERFYADFGNRTGDRAPLFYDLPECVAAHTYRATDR